jgi:hypothetical protein
VVDGTGIRLPDTATNQKAFPQRKNNTGKTGILEALGDRHRLRSPFDPL